MYENMAEWDFVDSVALLDSCPVASDVLETATPAIGSVGVHHSYRCPWEAANGLAFSGGCRESHG